MGKKLAWGRVGLTGQKKEKRIREKGGKNTYRKPT